MTMVKSKEDILNITGTNYLVYALWGSDPDYPKYITYGFETERESYVFLRGMDEGEGWMGYVSGCGHNTDKKALENFETDIRDTHPHLFEETE